MKNKFVMKIKEDMGDRKSTKTDGSGGCKCGKNRVVGITVSIIV